MDRKIGLEEHFAVPETLNDSKGFLGDHVWPELEKRLLDTQDYRLSQMDKHGMQMMILSLNAPAIQAIPDLKRATETARRGERFLAAAGEKRPPRLPAPPAVRPPERTAQRLEQGPAGLPGEEEGRRILPRQLLPDRLGQLPHPDADRRHARGRLGPDPVFHRLAVRERRPRCRLVRRLPDCGSRQG